jgi:hypothetical protein
LVNTHASPFWIDLRLEGNSFVHVKTFVGAS